MRSHAITVLATVLTIPSCQLRCSGPAVPPPAGAVGTLPFAVSGPETWSVDGKPIRVESTYYIHFPAGGLQYCIDYPVEGEVPVGDVARQAAWPLIRYAVSSGAYRRVQVEKIGSGAEEVSYVGVALFRREGTAAKGYRVNLGVEDIRRRIAVEATTAK